MRNIGVYKTNVKDHSKAELIIETIHRYFPGAVVSFDLEDCDKVLRVENPIKTINDDKISSILEKFEIEIESMI